jgi:disulfide bond formation protein DsbB
MNTHIIVKIKDNYAVIFSVWGAICLCVAIAAAVLGSAYFFEYILNYKPCMLCLWQRIPYYVALGVGVCAFVLRGFLAPLAQQKIGLITLGLLALIFCISASLGGYHAGVEWGWWQGPSFCGQPSIDPASQAAFEQSLKNIRIVSCDAASWRFLGLSFAGWNFIVSEALALYSLSVATMRRKRKN